MFHRLKVLPMIKLNPKKASDVDFSSSIKVRDTQYDLKKIFRTKLMLFADVLECHSAALLRNWRHLFASNTRISRPAKGELHIPVPSAVSQTD